MTYDYLLWKAPLVTDADEAKRLVEPYWQRADESAFEPSPDVTAVAAELLRRFPHSETGPWGESIPDQGNDRVLHLNIRNSADEAVLDAMVELAREHGLILYDPQGPDVTLPTDPVDTGPAPPPRLIDYLKIVLMGVAAGTVFWLGWSIEVPVLNWILMIVGGFFLSVIVFLLWILIFPPKGATEKA